VSSWRITRRRDAPSDNLIPISRWRETARASSRLATLAQPISRISPKAKKIGAKNASTSSDSGMVPLRGTRLMFAVRAPGGRPPDCPAAQTASPAVAV
jgi:hypothetical protein